MYVVFRIVRIVIVENVSDVLNIFAKVSIASPQWKYDDSVGSRVQPNSLQSSLTRSNIVTSWSTRRQLINSPGESLEMQLELVKKNPFRLCTQLVRVETD